MTWFGKWKTRFATTIAMVLLISSVSMAQATATASSDSDTDTDEATPTLVVSTSKVEQFLGHVTYLMRAAGQPEFGGMATMMVNQYSRGLDRTRPIGVAVTLNESGNPQPVVLLPVSDLEGFFAGLAQNNLGEPEDLGDGLYSLEVGPRPVFAQESEGWLVVGPEEEAVTEFEGDPTELLKNLSANYDIGVSLDVQSVPDQVRDLFLGQMKEAFSRTAAQGAAMKERELDEAEQNAKTDAEKADVAAQRAIFEAGQKVQQEQLAQIEAAINDTEEVVVGITSDPSTKQVYLEVATKFLEDSDIDKQLARSAKAKTALAGIHRPGEAVSFSSADLLDPNQASKMTQSVGTMFDTLTAELAKQDGAPKGVDAAIQEFKDVLIATIKEGVADSTVSVSLTPALSILGATHVADGSKVASAVQKLHVAVQDLPQVPKIKFNASTYKGTVIHLGSMDLPDGADPEAVKVLGKTINFALGTAPKNLLFSIGDSAEANLKAAIDRTSSASPAAATPFDLNIDVGTILQYIQSIQPNPFVETMAQTAAQYSANDSIVGTTKIVPHGVVIRFAIQEGVIRAAGAAAKAGQGGAGGPRRSPGR